MLKQLLKTALVATTMTFAVSGVVNAKPIPKNITAQQIREGMEAGEYNRGDLDAAINKKQPNVLGFMAYGAWVTERYDLALSYAKAATSQNNALGQYVEGMLYGLGYKQKDGLNAEENKRFGSNLVRQACKRNVVQQQVDDSVMADICRQMKK